MTDSVPLADCAKLIIVLCWAVSISALLYQTGVLIGIYLAYHPEHTPAALAHHAWYVVSGQQARDRAAFEEWASRPEVVQMARDMAAAVSKLGYTADDVKNCIDSFRSLGKESP